MGLIVNECLKCGHFWPQRGQQRSRVCPKCRSAWWDVPTKRKAETEAEDYPDIAVEPMPDPRDKIIADLQRQIDEIKNAPPKPTASADDIPEKIIDIEEIPGPLKERAFNCAENKKFQCLIRNGIVDPASPRVVVEDKELCLACASLPFWKNAANLRESLGITNISAKKPYSEVNFESMPYEEVISYARTCPFKVKSPDTGKNNCNVRNKIHQKGVLQHGMEKLCGICCELNEIWGTNTAGYNQRIKLPDGAKGKIDPKRNNIW